MNYSMLIKKLREKMLVTQEELAQILDVSFATINRWENNRTIPTMKAKRKIKELCKKYKVPFNVESAVSIETK